MSIDYEEAKEEFKRSVLVPMIAKLRDAIDNETTWTNKKIEIVKEMAKKIEDAGIVEPNELSQYLKKFFKENAVDISDDTIERACGEGKKRKHNRYQELANPQRGFTNDENKKVIEQTTNGRSNIRPYRASDKGIDPHIKEEMDREREELPDVNDNLYASKYPTPEELLKQIKDLEDGREHDREAVKTMQKQIDNLKEENRLIELKAAEAETRRKATQQDFDKLKERTVELEEALKKSIQKEGFAPASQLPKSEMPTQMWLPAIDALHLFIPLRKARDTAIDNNQPWRKILFEVQEDGRVKEAHLADV